jgi:hypothetical protein
METCVTWIFFSFRGPYSQDPGSTDRTAPRDEYSRKYLLDTSNQQCFHLSNWPWLISKRYIIRRTDV